MSYILPSLYAPGGLDLKMPHFLRNTRNARNGDNFDILPTLHLVKRKGYAMKDENSGGYGLVNYEKWENTQISVAGFGAFAFGTVSFGSPTTLGFGTISNTLVTLDSTPKYWTTTNFEITYTGSGTATLMICANSAGHIELVLSENGSVVLTSNLGDGTEASPVTLSSLETSIDALSNFTATTPSGAGSVPAAFLDWMSETSLTINTPFNVGVGYWTDMNTPITDPLPKITERITQDDYENPASLSINGVLYISNGYDDVRKYDGQTLYKAGLPRPTAPSGALDTGTSAGATLSAIFKYRITYEQKDAIGNVLESDISNASSAIDNTTGGPYAIDVTVTNLGASSGYNTNCAIVNGTQTSTNAGTDQETLTVDSGHTLEIGDTAYFYDKTSSAYVELEVLSTTATTVTFSSSGTLSVDDNQVISNNLKVNIYRAEVVGGTEPALSDYSLVVTIPHDSINSTQVYKDTVIPANLLGEYVEPIKAVNTPPKGRYLKLWRNQMIIAGDPGSPTRLYYSEFADVTNPENFPTVNFVDTPQGGGGRITGLEVLGQNLIIFMENQIYMAEGNLASDQVRIDLVSDSVGCVAFHTIHQIDGNVFFLSNKGLYRLFKSGAGMSVQKVSESIDSVFRLGPRSDYENYWKRAVATVWVEENKYLLFLPSETNTGGNIYADSDSRVYVYDLNLGEWYRWKNINALGGIVEFDDGNANSIWFHSRESGGNNRLYRFNVTESEVDYADHTSAIDFTYWPQWEFLRNPRSRKIYTDISVDSLRSSSQLGYTPTGTVDVEVYRDFYDGQTNESTITLTFPSDDFPVTESLNHRSCRSIGVKFSNNTINNQVLITGWSFEAMQYDQSLRRL